MGSDEKLWFSEFAIMKVPRNDPEGGAESVSLPQYQGPATAAYHKRLADRSREIRDRVEGDQVLDPTDVRSDLNFIIDNDIVDDVYDYAMCASEHREEMYSHPLEVTFVALRLGKGMGYDRDRLLDLGLAAFFENVGMYKIPGEILCKRGRLDEKEMAVIRNHPEMSRQILLGMAEPYHRLADVALQVHERWDGSGYPKGLKGNEISETASIIGLADTYVAMIKHRPYRDKLLQTEAIKLIVKEGKGLFPARLLKVFLDHISLFPVNTLVRLNNRSIGRVVATDHKQPLRPIVELIYDGEENLLENRVVIRLCDNPLLHIVESIDERDLAK
ncbi:MAG: HD-GYP domain-containing protein [Desulfatiglandales bacterium]